MDRTEFLAEARAMYAAARLRFITEAAPHITDEETSQKALSFVDAIGEVSPDEALDALLRWKRERGKL